MKPILTHVLCICGLGFMSLGFKAHAQSSSEFFYQPQAGTHIVNISYDSHHARFKTSGTGSKISSTAQNLFLGYQYGISENMSIYLLAEVSRMGFTPQIFK